MRIVYMGTPEFAVSPLKRLYSDGYQIVGVFTQPDKPRNRGMKISYSPVKEVALSYGTQIFQPTSLTDTSVVEIISKLNCDVIVVVAYGKLLPKTLLDLPPMGCINVHASLLPKYRGAAPINWAIINGETETGVTSIFMSEELDTGDILLSGKTSIGDDETAGQLHDRLSIAGADLISETIASLSTGDIVPKPQNKDEATYAPQLTRAMSTINWNEKAIEIKRKVRGLDPWPTATTPINGTVFKLFAVDIVEKSHDHIPGEIVSVDKTAINIACNNGFIAIKELQAPGGKRMSTSEYMKGHTFTL